jgi:hypothetical protein
MEPVTIFALIVGAAWLVKGKFELEIFPSDKEPDYSPSSYPREIQDFARAIARAEGFYIVGSAPYRAHNPGALKMPGWKGPTTGDQGISVFGSDAEGWDALHRQLWLIATGKSGVYNVDMSILDMARKWTNTEQSGWSQNVANALGVPTSTKLSQVLV